MSIEVGKVTLTEVDCQLFDRDGEPMKSPADDWRDVFGVRRIRWISLEEAKVLYPDYVSPQEEINRRRSREIAMLPQPVLFYWPTADDEDEDADCY